MGPTTAGDGNTSVGTSPDPRATTTLKLREACLRFLAWRTLTSDGKWQRNRNEGSTHLESYAPDVFGKEEITSGPKRRAGGCRTLS